MTHLTRAELAAWHATPAESDRAHIVGHLAECDVCGAMYAELIRAHVPDALEHFTAGQFRDAGYAALAPSHGRMLLFRPRVLLPVAAAAAILLAVWVPTLRREDDPARSTPQVLRGGVPEAIAPSGDVTGPIEFRWTAPAGADRYAVEVKGQDGRRVFYRETRDPRLSAGAELDAALAPGGAFTWTVATLDGSGEVIAESHPRAFTRSPR